MSLLAAAWELERSALRFYLGAYLRPGPYAWQDAPADPHLPALLEHTRPGFALDAGCGAGRNTLELAERGWQVVGLDLFARPLALARQRAKAQGLEARARFVQGAASRLDVLMPSARFDLVLDLFGPASDLDEPRLGRYARALQARLTPQGFALVFTYANDAELRPLLERFEAAPGPTSPAGRWLRLTPKGAA